MRLPPHAVALCSARVTALFELVDLYVPTLNVDDYVSFVRRLTSDVSRLRQEAPETSSDEDEEVEEEEEAQWRAEDDEALTEEVIVEALPAEQPELASDSLEEAAGPVASTPSPPLNKSKSVATLRRLMGVDSASSSSVGSAESEPDDEDDAALPPPPPTAPLTAAARLRAVGGVVRLAASHSASAPILPCMAPRTPTPPELETLQGTARPVMRLCRRRQLAKIERILRESAHVGVSPGHERRGEHCCHVHDTRHRAAHAHGAPRHGPRLLLPRTPHDGSSGRPLATPISPSRVYRAATRVGIGDGELPQEQARAAVGGVALGSMWHADRFIEARTHPASMPRATSPERRPITSVSRAPPRDGASSRQPAVAKVELLLAASLDLGSVSEL